MKLITSVKNLFLYSLVLLITVCSLWLTPPSAIAAPVNVEATPQYIVADATADAQPKVKDIEEAIEFLRDEKVKIGKDKTVTIEVKKLVLKAINLGINNLLDPKKAV